MDKEVAPQVLAVIDEMRLSGPRLTPVDIVARMGVLDAREKASEQAWLATGDNVIATVWAERVEVGDGGHWFCLESLDAQRRADGGTRTPFQTQRIKDRLALLKKTFDAGQGFRAVLQTNRVPIAELETSRSAKVSTRVRDDDEWHVAEWAPQRQIAVLVRGPRGWTPGEAEIQAARARSGLPEEKADPGLAVTGPVSQEAVQAAAMDYVMRHFKGYGYKAEDVTARALGYDIEVSNAKGATLLRVVVKGTAGEIASFRLTSGEEACSAREPLWRLLVVSDAIGSTAQHKIYKPAEMTQAPGFEAQGR